MASASRGVGLGPHSLPCGGPILTLLYSGLMLKGPYQYRKQTGVLNSISSRLPRSIWDPPGELSHDPGWAPHSSSGCLFLPGTWGCLLASEGCCGIKQPLQTFLQTLNGNCDGQQVSERRNILLQWFLSLQYVFNNEHATVFIHPIFLKQGWLEKKKKQLFFQTFDLKTALFLIQKTKTSLSATLSVFSLVQMLIPPLV